MTQIIDQKNLERKLIRAFALADAWFDFVDDGMAVMDIGERILLLLNKLQTMLTHIKGLPIHEDNGRQSLMRNDNVLKGEYFNTLSQDCAHDVTGHRTARQLLREHLYYYLVLLELESTPGLSGRTITLHDGKTMTTADYIHLVVVTVDTMLAELNQEVLNDS